MHHLLTLGELTKWAELRQWGRRNRDAPNHWLNGVIVLPYTDDVARTWGQISAYAIHLALDLRTTARAPLTVIIRRRLPVLLSQLLSAR